MIEKVKLGEQVEFQRGYDLTHDNMNGGPYPVVGSTSIIGYHDTYKAEDGITIGRSGTVGIPRLINGKYWPHNTSLFTTDLKGNNREYLFYLLTNLHIDKMKTGSTVPTLNRNDLYPLEIPFETDVSEQKKIARFLSSIDYKISNNEAICSDLESMAKTLYDYWFVQFDFPDENGKPYKSSGGKMVWNEELKREIPEGWEVKTVGSMLGIYPKTVSVPRDDYKKGSRYPIVDQSKEYICGYTDDEERVLHMDDAVVFGDHTNVAKYVNFDFARGADGTQIINSNEIRLPNYVLYLQICSFPIIEEGYSRHYKFLKEQKAVIPNVGVSAGYMEIVKPALEERRRLIEENRELSSLRDYLLPMLMNGQVSVK